MDGKMYTFRADSLGNVVREDSKSMVLIGLVDKTETLRIDNDNVVDISSTFDFGIGEYVETGRITRYEPDPFAKSPLELKLAELNAACNAAILAGFTSDALGSDNIYDFDYDAQINLGGMLNAITAGLVAGDIVWKASGIPQVHTVDQFKAVFGAGLAFKNSMIAHYWTLKAAVNDATSQEEIEAITW